MSVVLDTNTVISAFFWQGAPRRVLNLARDEKIQIVTSPILLAELEDVLSRPKFATRLMRANTHVDFLVTGYAALATTIMVKAIAPVIEQDTDDDHVLACAVAAHANWIVSGDYHLLQLQQYQGIKIGLSRN